MYLYDRRPIAIDFANNDTPLNTTPIDANTIDWRKRFLSDFNVKADKCRDYGAQMYSAWDMMGSHWGLITDDTANPGKNMDYVGDPRIARKIDEASEGIFDDVVEIYRKRKIRVMMTLRDARAQFYPPAQLDPPDRLLELHDKICFAQREYGSNLSAFYLDSFAGTTGVRPWTPEDLIRLTNAHPGCLIIPECGRGADKRYWLQSLPYSKPDDWTSPEIKLPPCFCDAHLQMSDEDFPRYADRIAELMASGNVFGCYLNDVPKLTKLAKDRGIPLVGP